MQITGYNFNGTPIYGPSNDIVITAKKETTKSSFDWNNVIDNIPGAITAISNAVRRPEQPIVNMYNDPNNQGGNNNTMLYIGAAIVLVVIVVMMKK